MIKVRIKPGEYLIYVVHNVYVAFLFQVITIFTQLPQGILMKILRGASPEEVTDELAKIPKTKSYDDRAEAR